MLLSFKKYYAAVFLWIHVHVKWNHVGFDSLCISTSYLLAIVSVMGPSHSKLSWEMLSAQLFIYWHLFHCAVTYMYMYMSIYFVFIETNYNKYYILSCIVFLIPKYTLNQSFLKCSPSIIYLLYEISTFICLVVGATDFHLTFNSYKQCIDLDLWL